VRGREPSKKGDAASSGDIIITRMFRCLEVTNAADHSGIRQVLVI